MARIPEDAIQGVLEAADIAEVVSRHVSLRPSGRSLKGLCPFHEEKTPSFHVFPQSRRFKCFGCGEGGDVFSFLMRHQKLTFIEVVRDLAREYGVPLPEEAGDLAGEDASRRSAALEALRFAAGFFRTVLNRDTGRPARDYLARRGISAATIEEFGLGFSPDEWEGLHRYALGKGFGEEALFDAGLTRRNEAGRVFDMFRGRVMFPIHDARGRVIGFGARTLGEDQPKYLNSPDGPLFKKGRELYGAALARPAALRAGRVLVVEGYTDVILCHQAGMKEVVAGLGTALTPDNARTLRRFGVPVLLLYDGDEAGLRAAERASDVLLAENVEGSVALLPGGEDPADIVVRTGTGPIDEALRSSRDLFDYRLDRARGRHDCSTLEGRTAAVGELLETARAISNPVRRDVAYRLLAERMGVSESTLRDLAGSARRRGTGGDPPAGPAATPPAWIQAERDFVACALVDPVAWQEVEQAYPAGSFRDDALRAVAEAAVQLARDGRRVTRAALLEKLAQRDDAVSALESLEAEPTAAARARQHLSCIAQDRRVRSALAGDTPLEGVIAARRGGGTPQA